MAKPETLEEQRARLMEENRVAHNAALLGCALAGWPATSIRLINPNGEDGEVVLFMPDEAVQVTALVAKLLASRK